MHGKDNNTFTIIAVFLNPEEIVEFASLQFKNQLFLSYAVQNPIVAAYNYMLHLI
jgi:hypothetical protein